MIAAIHPIILAVVLFGAFTAPVAAQDRARVDLFRADGQRDGYAIIERESGRLHFFDRSSRRTGYGKVDDAGRVERFDTHGRRVPATALPRVRGGQK